MTKQITADFATVVAESQKQALATITQAHESMLRIAEFGLSSIPSFSASPESLPKPTDLVRASYDFTGKVLEEQKSFALKLTEITSARVDESRKNVAEALKQR